SVMVGARVVGTVTSGAWGHRVGMNLAYAFIDAPLASVGAELTLDLLGARCAAHVIAPSPFDPDMTRPRS
ncbi:MAG: glycine cleavage T C-terminal barrel domain-containing protein, partial [Pseudomonadota bacterium]